MENTNGGLSKSSPNFRWLLMYTPNGTVRNSMFDIGLCFRTPNAPMLVAVVSDSMIAPRNTPWAQLNDCDTGTDVSESLPPYMNPLTTTP